MEPAPKELILDEPVPTPEQQQAIDDFFTFMLSDNTEYHLSGGAGVGKTFTLDKIMGEGMSRYEQACALMGIEQMIFSIALTATTNKAAEVLSQATNKPAQTIHSFMGFRVMEDFSTGETKITTTNNTVVVQNTLIIIDECSMIDNKLYELLHKYTHNCKFLYVGDHCQMAPVFEKLSRIYKNKEFFSNLITPMRNAGQPALVQLCKQLRTTVETGIFQPIIEVPGIIDYLSGSEMSLKVDEIFLNQNHNSRILCYRNQQVKDFNQHIRSIRGLPDYYEKGEHLVCANSYQVGQTKISVEQEVEVIENPYEESTKKVHNVEFDVYKLFVRKKYGPVFAVYLPSDPNHFNELVKYFARQKLWSAYFHLKQGYPDLRQRDASTVYKAQGSTYDSVFVDLQDISSCKHADQVARMLYVACSRPQNRLYLYGKLKPAYSGG